MNECDMVNVNICSEIVSLIMYKYILKYIKLKYDL